MARSIQINRDNFVFPHDKSTTPHASGDVVRLTDEQFNALPSGAFAGGSPPLTDLGLVADADDDVSAQAANVAALGALTATAPAALTSAQISGGEAPTEAEYNALQADVAAVRTTLAAAVTDLGTIRAKVNAEIAALTGEGKPQAAS